MVEKHSRHELVQKIIKLACCQTKILDGAIFHSDRVCQYTAKKTKELLEHYGFRISMSRLGTLTDKQPIENFWKTLTKSEMANIRHLGYEKAKQEILCYIYLYYNSEGLHSGIGYKTPNSVWMKNLLFYLSEILDKFL